MKNISMLRIDTIINIIPISILELVIGILLISYSYDENLKSIILKPNISLNTRITFFYQTLAII